jgi:hypothetical protein
MTFRSDGVLLLECVDGFGSYVSLGSFFAGFFWTNNYYQGYPRFLFISGFASDPYLIGSGIDVVFGKGTGPVIITGYLL